MKRLPLALACLGLAHFGCGSSANPTPSPTPTSSADSKESRDTAIERRLDERAKAAAAGDRAGVSRAERELDRLAAQTQNGSTARSKDPYLRLVTGFRFKTAPLYVQQIEYSSSDHQLFVRVNRDAFCLLTQAARIDAVEKVYGPADRALREADVRDFEFLLVPLSDRVSSEKDALAIGAATRVRLTRAGSDCAR